MHHHTSVEGLLQVLRLGSDVHPISELLRCIRNHRENQYCIVFLCGWDLKGHLKGFTQARTAPSYRYNLLLHDPSSHIYLLLLSLSSGVPELVPADVCQLAVAAALPDAAVAAVAGRGQRAAGAPHGRRRRRRLEARLPGALQAAALLAGRAVPRAHLRGAHRRHQLRAVRQQPHRVGQSRQDDPRVEHQDQQPLGSVQQSSLLSQFLFQCCNLPQLTQENVPFHLNWHITILNFDLLKMSHDIPPHLRLLSPYLH